MEKRVPIAIVVHLARAEDHRPEGPELTYTDNISAHGACVVSERQWESGEIAEVTSLNDRITLRGSVAYCARREKGRYGVGLNFNAQEVTWNPDVKVRGPSGLPGNKEEVGFSETAVDWPSSNHLIGFRFPRAAIPQPDRQGGKCCSKAENIRAAPNDFSCKCPPSATHC